MPAVPPYFGRYTIFLFVLAIIVAAIIYAIAYIFLPWVRLTFSKTNKMQETTEAQIDEEIIVDSAEVAKAKIDALKRANERVKRVYSKK